MTDDQISEILSKMNIPLEWIWLNWENIRSLSFSSTNEVEFSDLIGDWFDLDKADGLC